MILLKEQIKEKLNAGEENSQSIIITTENADYPFDEDAQVGLDSIDLRINDVGYIMNAKYSFINTLSDEDFSKYFTKVHLSMDGFDLKPNQILFIDTLERIHLKGNFFGQIEGRSVFARLGLTVHCTQTKFSRGINSIVPLQIRNNSNTTLRIFPFQKLAQLTLFETSRSSPNYTGKYSNEKNYTLPTIRDNDRIQYGTRDSKKITSHKGKVKLLRNESGDFDQTKFLIFSQSVIGFVCSMIIALISVLSTSAKSIGIISVFLFQISFSIISYILSNKKE